MTPATLDRRLATLETNRETAPRRYTPEEREAAARAYAEFLVNPPPPDPRAEAYWSGASLHQIAADYTAMLSGAPAPWL